MSSRILVASTALALALAGCASTAVHGPAHAPVEINLVQRFS